MNPIPPPWIIAKKRDGGVLNDQEIRSFIQGYHRGDIPDYQMAALAMAILFRGMNAAEKESLTDAMMRSGEILDTSSIAMPKVDKHSTGGVGDKVSLALAPLVACCQVAVPMISGRGLGITGGTLDKLESIPGFRTRLTTREFLELIRKNGCAIIGQTDELAPVDRKLYALRDVTATVESTPLITASIMSKKLAAGIDHLVLDVKCGTGAFMKSRADARALADSMVAIGTRMGRGMAALITAMDQPLGTTVGNTLEVIETIELLKGSAPPDTLECVLTLGAWMLILSGRAENERAGIEMLRAKLDSGEALERFIRMVEAQGGDPRITEDFTLLPRAPHQTILRAPVSGYVHRMDAEQIGQAFVLLGGGRLVTSDRIDPVAGMTRIVKVGAPVERGDLLMEIHASDKALLEKVRDRLTLAVDIAPEPISPPPLILERIAHPLKNKDTST